MINFISNNNSLWKLLPFEKKSCFEELLPTFHFYIQNFSVKSFVSFFIARNCGCNNSWCFIIRTFLPCLINTFLSIIFSIKYLSPLGTICYQNDSRNIFFLLQKNLTPFLMQMLFHLGSFTHLVDEFRFANPILSHNYYLYKT